MKATVVSCLVAVLAAFGLLAAASRPALVATDEDVPPSGPLGVPARFDATRVVDDELFTASAAIDADGIQQILSETPWGTRSFLADLDLGGRPFAHVLAAAAADHGVNPLLLLSRLQVEQGLLSRTTPPPPAVLDVALGCGCRDSATCEERHRGLENQLQCAAAHHARLYRRSQLEAYADVSWRRGAARTTNDGVLVVPQNAATAALYGYTPWVLEGKGGQWLVWSVTRRVVEHADLLGAWRGLTPQAPTAPVDAMPRSLQAALEGIFTR